MGAWFKVGDRIRAKNSVATGTVVGSTFNSIQQESEYQLQWDHVKSVHTYTFDEGHAQWEQESPATSGEVYKYKVSWVNEETEVKKSSCDHIFAWYHGITENFEYCTKCDEKKQ